MTSMCECDWKGCRHERGARPAHDHGDVRVSPELCMECLYCCEGEREDEMDEL